MEYIIAKGLKSDVSQADATSDQPKPLFNILKELAARAQNNTKEKDFYIHLRLDTGRESLIRADMSSEPYQFWFFNLNRHPLPLAIMQQEKSILEEFGQCTDLNPLLKEEKQIMINATLSGEHIPVPDNLLDLAQQKLAEQKRPQLTKSWTNFFTHKPAEEKSNERLEPEVMKNKK